MLLRLVVEVDEVVGLVDEVDVELVEALVDDVLVETLVDEVDVVEVVGLVDDELEREVSADEVEVEPGTETEVDEIEVDVLEEETTEVETVVLEEMADVTLERGLGNRSTAENWSVLENDVRKRALTYEVDVLVLAVLLLEEAALLKSYTLSRLGPPHISLELPLHSIVHPLSVAIIAPFEIVLPQSAIPGQRRAVRENKLR